MLDPVFVAESHPGFELRQANPPSFVALALAHGANRHDDLHLLHDRHEFRAIHQNLPFVPVEDFQNHHRGELLVSKAQTNEDNVKLLSYCVLFQCMHDNFKDNLRLVN